MKDQLRGGLRAKGHKKKPTRLDSPAWWALNRWVCCPIPDLSAVRQVPLSDEALSFGNPLLEVLLIQGDDLQVYV